MMRLVMAAAIVTLLGASLTSAQENPYPIKGVGNSSCANYVDAYEAYRPFMGEDPTRAPPQVYANYVKFEEWLEGLMFGLISGTYEIHRKKNVTDYNPAAMRKWIYGFCIKNPTDLIATAGSVFFLEIGGVIPAMFAGEEEPPHG